MQHLYLKQMIYVNEGMCIYFYTIVATFCCINKKEVYCNIYKFMQNMREVKCCKKKTKKLLK